jgi:hypothetical protein
LLSKVGDVRLKGRAVGRLAAVTRRYVKHEQPHKIPGPQMVGGRWEKVLEPWATIDAPGEADTQAQAFSRGTRGTRGRVE